MDNVKIHEQLGNHFDINVKSESKKKRTEEISTKLDWNNMLRNKTAIGCWNILIYESKHHTII